MLVYLPGKMSYAVETWRWERQNQAQYIKSQGIHARRSVYVRSILPHGYEVTLIYGLMRCRAQRGRSGNRRTAAGVSQRGLEPRRQFVQEINGDMWEWNQDSGPDGKSQASMERRQTDVAGIGGGVRTARCALETPLHKLFRVRALDRSAACTWEFL